MKRIVSHLLFAFFVPLFCMAQNERVCFRCKGDGSLMCLLCRGSGIMTNYSIYGVNYVTCTGCEGDGYYQCPTCRGTGYVSKPKKGNNTYYHIQTLIVPSSFDSQPELIEYDPSDPETSYINAIIHNEERVIVTNIHGQKDIYIYEGKDNKGRSVYIYRSGKFIRYLQVGKNTIEIRYDLQGACINCDIYQKMGTTRPN